MSKHDRSEDVKEWAKDLNFAVAKELWNFPHKYGGSNFSDIRDDEGNYYVDLVLGGGGMLGMAHAGFIHALEESDLKFRAVAGSSAGALSAALLMGIRPDKKWKGLFLGALLGALEGDELLDTVTGQKWFRGKFKKRAWINLLPSLMAFCRYLFFRGIIKGDTYENRLVDTLQEIGKEQDSPKKVVGRMTNPPKLTVCHETGEDDIKGLEYMRLKIVAANITQEEKVVYPDDRGQYDAFPEDKDQHDEDKDQLDKDKDQLDKDIRSVARWVRASSSVPIVFEPVRMTRAPAAMGDGPPQIDVVDGGLMSNFPISVFHRPDDEKAKKWEPEVGQEKQEAETGQEQQEAEAGQEQQEAEADPKKRVEGFYLTPRLPTFGCQLIAVKDRPNKTDCSWHLTKALIKSMMDVGDEDFIATNPDYRLVVTKIDVTEIEPFKSSNSDLEAFNLYLSREDKIGLFVHGYVRGKEFLKGFDWYGYKNLRRDMASERDKTGESDK